MEFRALTLWQPWASFIIAGLKTWETRSWQLPEPGWVAIHAAKREPVQVPKLIAQSRRMFHNALEYMLQTTYEQLPRGKVLGVVKFGQCVPVEQVRMQIGAADADFGDWADGRWAWPVKNVWRLRIPIPAHGRQRLWQWTMPERDAAAFRLFYSGDECDA